MDKPYLLIAGEAYYPEAGTGDWIGFFETYEQAKSCVEIVEVEVPFRAGPRRGQVKEIRTILKVNGVKRDWYEIVDVEMESRLLERG